MGCLGPFETLGALFLEGPQGLVPSTSGIISPALTVTAQRDGLCDVLGSVQLPPSPPPSDRRRTAVDRWPPSQHRKGSVPQVVNTVHSPIGAVPRTKAVTTPSRAERRTSGARGGVRRLRRGSCKEACIEWGVDVSISYRMTISHLISEFSG